MKTAPAPGEKLSLLSGLVTAFLLCTAFILIFFVLTTILEPLMPRALDTGAPIGTWENCEFTATGHLYLKRPVDANSREPFSTSGERLSSNRLPAQPGEKEGESIYPNAPMVQFFEQFHPEPQPEHERLLFSNLGSGFEYWYLIKHKHPKVHGYFVGYQAASRKWLGYVGRNGFQEHRPSVDESIPLVDARHAIIAPPGFSWNQRGNSLPTPVESAGSWDEQLETGRRIWLATPEGIWQCNLGDRSIKPFASLENVQALQCYNDTTKRTLMILAATSQGLRLFDESGQERSRANFSWPKIQLDKNNILASRHVALTLANELILIESDPPKLKETSQITTISWFDTSGKLAKQAKQTLSLYEFADANRPKVPIFSATNTFEMFLGGLSFTHNILQYFTDGAPLIPREQAPYMAVNVLLTLLLIVLVCWRQQRLGQPWSHSLAWTLFLLIFGAAGFFGYLFHKPWAAALRCAACGKIRPAESTLCPHCGEPVQKPKLLDTEIFLSEPRLALAQTG